jgi:hypothetical protein
MKHKNNRIKQEYKNLNLDSRVKALIETANAILIWKYPGYHMTITDIYRTQDEQDEIYSEHKTYQDNPWQSVHQDWRGIDAVVIKDSTGRPSNKIMKEICDIMVSLFDYNDDGTHNVCIFHNIKGRDKHLHFQVHWEEGEFIYEICDTQPAQEKDTDNNS